jgi:endo-1,4-beta-xylanase
MSIHHPTHLRELADRRGFYVGAAVNTAAFTSGETTYREMLQREFNVLVAENMMKFGELSPAPNEYNWTNSDMLVDFAEANGMKLRGHTLVWHQQLPRWLTSRAWTAREAEELLEQHIKTVVGRYQGRVWAWDVVNEAIADGGGYRTDSFWYRQMGSEYIAKAFRWAHEADPHAILYYNDYEAEALSPKSDAVYELARDLKRADTPLHGAGWQMHLGEGWRMTEQHRANAARLKELGLELSMTEMDVRLRTPPSAAQLESQAESYREALELALETCVALVTWGFTDKYSWIPSFRPGFGAALPFGANYEPKPAFYAMQRVMAGINPDPESHTDG